MSKRLYEVIVNMLLFFFILTAVTGVEIQGGNLAARLIIGLIFGVLMAYAGVILQFFKINVNTWSILLVSVILAFLFFFALSTGLGGIVKFGGGKLDLGIAGMVVAIADKISMLIFLAVVSALASVGLKKLGKN